MNTDSPSGRPRVALLTLGCAKNVVDSERILSVLESRGVEVVHSLGESQVAIINTCAFIEPAKEESIDVVLDAAEWKRKGLETLIVTGCLVERYSDALKDLMPEVDVLTGIDPEGTALAALKAAGRPARALDCVPARRSRRLTPSWWSYLRISHGCDNRCSYCAIPFIRGPLRSRPLDDLLGEARYLAAQGVRELNVIAQDTAAYGGDLGEDANIAKLLRELCRIEALKWIRLLYCHPAHVTDDLIDVVAGEERICPYMDVPLQHANDDILSRMGRKIKRAEVEDLIGKMRERIPGLALRTTFIVGFPGEGEAEFEELLDFVRRFRFERVGCFSYWREEGTRAARMPRQVPREIGARRREELMAVQQEIAFELAARRVGERCEVIIEEGGGGSGEFALGRSRHEAPDVDPVILVSGAAPAPGEFAEVEIVDSAGYDCVARVIKEDT